MAAAAKSVLSPGPFELKSALLSAVALVLRTSDLAELAAAMRSEFGETPTLFDHDPVVIDLSPLAADAPLDIPALVALLRAQRLLPVGVRGGSAAHTAAALEAGLGEVAVDAPANPSPRRLPAAEADADVAAPAAVDSDAATQEGTAVPSGAEPATAASASASASAPAPESVPTPEDDRDAATDLPEPPLRPHRAATVIVDRPLRSGQQVYAKGGDLIVLAAVNFGAEVLADGNIHVYGPLRGKAVAGAKGDTSARIFSTCLEPELVAIAGTYRTTENPLPAEVLGRPAQIRLAAERLVFEPLP